MAAQPSRDLEGGQEDPGAGPSCDRGTAVLPSSPPTHPPPARGEPQTENLGRGHNGEQGPAFLPGQREHYGSFQPASNRLPAARSQHPGRRAPSPPPPALKLARCGHRTVWQPRDGTVIF